MLTTAKWERVLCEQHRFFSPITLARTCWESMRDRRWGLGIHYGVVMVFSKGKGNSFFVD